MPVNFEVNIIAILNQRNPGAGVLADVEGFVLRETDRGGVATPSSLLGNLAAER